MTNIANDITELIGKTPLVRLNKMSGDKANILLKMESFNPGGSVKDRIGLNMIQGAEKDGLINKGTVLIEPTSGNTGIALAWVSAVKGYRLILTMPDSMSRERVGLLKAAGAEIELTPAYLGMQGAINRAEELLKEIPSSIMLQQFKNKYNPEMHRNTTALEIWSDTDGEIDCFVSAVGTGGTITGVGEVLKEKKTDIEVVAVEPFDSSVLSGKPPGPHMIQGIGAGFVPDILNRKVIDQIIRVRNDDALNTARELAKQEGIFCGISAGANVFAAIELSKRKENEGKTIVTVICDSGERYLSTNLYK